MRVLFFILLFVLLSLAVVPLVAQDLEATEEAPLILGETDADGVLIVPTGAVVQDTLDVQFAAFVAIIITTIWNLIYIPVAAPLVELATSISKRLPFLNTVSSPTLTFGFTVLAWIGYIILTQLGYGDRFDNLITGLTTIATTIFSVPITQKVAQNIHGFAQANNVPVFGYSRTPSMSVNIRNAIAASFENEIRALFDKISQSPAADGKVPLTEAA